MWKKVLATHVEPQQLAVGPWLGDTFPGVALPHRRALKRWVTVRYKDKQTWAQVMDVGPWTIDDSPYVFGIERPRAEYYLGRTCPLTEGGFGHASVPDGNGKFKAALKSNGAGIDLFPATAKELGIAEGDNVQVEWSFADDV